MKHIITEEILKILFEGRTEEESIDYPTYFIGAEKLVECDFAEVGEILGIGKEAAEEVYLNLSNQRPGDMEITRKIFFSPEFSKKYEEDIETLNTIIYDIAKPNDEKMRRINAIAEQIKKDNLQAINLFGHALGEAIKEIS